MTALPAKTGGMTRTRPKGASFDPLFLLVCGTAATLLLSALAGIVGSLLIGGWPALSHFKLDFFTSSEKT